MAKSSKVTLTQRQRESARASRAKAARKRWHARWQKARLALLVIGGVTLVGGGGWMWHSGGFVRLYEGTAERFYSFTAQSGFTVQASYLEGRRRTDADAIKEALGFKKGDPILKLSLAEMKARLEAIPSVKEAAVERSLPHTLFVRIIEREPVAIWQHEGKLSLIDDEGVTIHDLDLEDYRQLPQVIGDGAPKHVREVLALLNQEPDLAGLVQAVVRVGDRRWNMRLKQGVEVKLPQEKASDAWHQVAILQREQQLLMRDIRAIDLREADRVTIRLPTRIVPLPGAHPAKET